MTLGTAVGVLPGIGRALTVALLLPVTYGPDPAGSLIMFAGIYYGGMYGGSTTSILRNTPGESASIVTAIEGNKMAKAGPEAANNAAAAGTLVPLLTLGLPTTATAAIMLAAFQQVVLQPGPLLFLTNAPLVWGLIANLLIVNIKLLVLNLPLIGLWLRLLRVPKPWLYGGILVSATLGTIGVNPSRIELGMLILFSVLGYGRRPYGYPIATVVVGLILGLMAVQQLRRALSITQGDWMTLVSNPVSAVLLAISALFLIVPLILRLRDRGQVLSAMAGHSDEGGAGIEATMYQSETRIRPFDPKRKGALSIRPGGGGTLGPHCFTGKNCRINGIGPCRS